MNLNIAPSIIEHSSTLLNALESDDGQLPLAATRIDDALHKLTMLMLNFQHKQKGNFICPIYRFIIYSSISSSGQILNPAGVNGILTELKWPFRASTFWEIVCQLEQLESDAELECPER